MPVTDQIGDMLTRIRNAIQAKHATVSFPASGLKREICRILVEEKYIKKFVVLDDGKQGIIKALLKFKSGVSVISGLRRVSVPGRRVYRGSDKIPKVLSGLGSSIVSTPRGVMTGKDARNNKVGGEVLCYIW